MGQANRAPKPFYGRKFQISSHAIERFRERVDEEFCARPDNDLANLLDERIRNAERSEDVIDHSYRDTPSKIYVIQSRKGQQALAVVRENTCVTVLDEDMLQGNIAKRTWTLRAINTPFVGALAGMSAPRLATPATPPTPHQRATPPKLETKPVEIDPIAAAGLELAAARLEVAQIQQRIAETNIAFEKAKERAERARNSLDELIARTVTATTKEK